MLLKILFFSGQIVYLLKLSLHIIMNISTKEKIEKRMDAHEVMKTTRGVNPLMYTQFDTSTYSQSIMVYLGLLNYTYY
jgi:hypothetical protein